MLKEIDGVNHDNEEEEEANDIEDENEKRRRYSRQGKKQLYPKQRSGFKSRRRMLR
jgi:hypothetical protein